MTLSVRAADADDAAFLVSVIDMASEGLLPAIWEEMAPDGMDGSAVGLAMVSSEEGELSYRNGFILDEEGVRLGGLIGYPLPTEPEPIGPETPEAFVAIKELETLILGYWYINFVAIVPEGRAKGLGTRLLDAAEAQARSSSCPGVALIVAESNAVALHTYERAEYSEIARRPFDLSAFGVSSTEALLLVKDIS